MPVTAADRAAPPRARLWVEFLALFVCVPLALAFLLPPSAMFSVLGVMTALGIVLLHRTPGFDWRELRRGPVPWRAVLGFAVATAVVATGATLWLMPENFLILPRRQTGLWLMILILYPMVSALPQELLFRPLFFRRYGSLFPTTPLALAVNAVVFSVAHLVYMHPLVAAMTLAGGWFFGWVYAVRGSFAAAVLAHALAGQIVFTSGLGRLFYSGAVN